MGEGESIIVQEGKEKQRAIESKKGVKSVEKQEIVEDEMKRCDTAQVPTFSA